MNVLHLDEQIGWRGGEQQASWLMAGLVDRGHRVALCGKAGGRFVQAEHAGRPVARETAAYRNEADLATAWRLARIVARQCVDILHAHTSHAHTMACLARMFARRGKVVVSRRVSFVPRSGHINRWKYSLPDMFLCVSGKVDEVLAEYGIPEGQRRVVYSAVDAARLDVPAVSRESLGIPGEAPLLVSAGALVGHKDHETLVKAMARVVAEKPEAMLAIAGEGKLRPRVESLVQELSLTNSVRLLGHRDDAPAVIRAADIYVSSSWSEGLGTSVLEGLACGVPVVATVAGGIPEMIRNGETGYLVPNRDSGALAAALLEALNDKDGARKMAVRGPGFVAENFSVERMVADTIGAYEELLEA
ncbi:MAG TPA: glycosyltransferase [Gammaproteobacteria bacterium]|nr:glycosyltransferase [Gammaproteobacteria bacterium]